MLDLRRGFTRTAPVPHALHGNLAGDADAFEEAVSMFLCELLIERLPVGDLQRDFHLMDQCRLRTVLRRRRLGRWWCSSVDLLAWR